MKMTAAAILPVILGLALLVGEASAQAPQPSVPSVPPPNEVIGSSPPLGPTEAASRAEVEPELPRIERAQPSPPPGEERPRSSAARPPVLAWLESQGVSLTALGEEGGLHAYLGEAAGGQMQVFYVTPDGQHLVAGLMFREGGANVTAAQLAAMRERFDAERRRIQEQERRMATAQRTLDGGLDRALTPAPQRVPTPGAAEPAPAPVRGVSPEQAAHRDRVVRAAEATAWFSLGRDGAPVVYLLADPQCPHCHSVWAQLRPRVEAGDIMVKVILVGGLPGSEERAISILSRPEPGRAWFAGEGSTPARVAPPPAETSRPFQVARRLLQTNLEFAREMGVRGTPWLAYVARDGGLRTVEGATDMSVFLRDLR